MDILLSDDIIIDYRDADFGIENSALEFDAGFENLLGPSLVVVPNNSPPSAQQTSNVKEETGGNGTVEHQTLPESPPDSSGSPPSSVYSPVDVRQSRKRHRNSDAAHPPPGSISVDGTVICDLMLAEPHMKDGNKSNMQSYNLPADTSNGAMMSMQGGQCPFSTSNGDNIKPMSVPEPFPSHLNPAQSSHASNYVQLPTPPVYYTNYVDYDQSNSYANPNSAQTDDLYSHQSHHTFVDMPPDMAQGNAGEGLLMASPDPMQRKSRKMDRNNSSFEEASPGTSATPDSQYNTSDRGGVAIAGSTEGGEGSLPGTPMQCIRFEPFQSQHWHSLCDSQLQDLPLPHYRVDADKGFNFSASDEAFVCQKKNHFQVTCHTQLATSAGQVMMAGVTSPPGSTPTFNVLFVRTQNGLEKVRNFCLHFYGVKFEAPRHKIRVEQSQSDRSKKVFHPVVIDLHCGQVSKTTVGRLHFSETTSNNMRKKGRPNPEQRYFRLVVALHAHTHTGDYPVIVHGSEKIIVRASNPGQFENDFELCWQRGVTPDSIFHNGKIGLNTDAPDECLVVNGNLKVTGHILQPSDCRIKKELTELSTKEQLDNIQKIRIVKYSYSDGRPEIDKNPATGVMAQEVRRVLPDAVFEQQAAYQMPNGGKLDKFLVVNKDRIFLENVGAVKELSKVTGKLERRIEQLEICQSEMLSGKSGAWRRSSWDNLKLGNHSIQWIIVMLIIVMTVCLSILATLFFVEHYDAVRSRYYDSMGHHSRPEFVADARDGASTAAHLLGAKQQSLAYSHNYSTMNDHVLGHGSKSGKKSITYKTGDPSGGGGGVNPNQMPFPPFTDNRTGTAIANGGINLGVDPNAPLTWSNIEFSFLYIYKLQQYYNELQKKNKGKAPKQGTKGQQSVGADVNPENPSNTEDDCDSTEVGGEDNLNPSGGGDLKLDEEVMNRILANLLTTKNEHISSDPVDTRDDGEVKIQSNSDIPSDESAIEKTVKKSAGALSTDIPESTTRATVKKDQKPSQESGSAQQQDLENLINSNN